MMLRIRQINNEITAEIVSDDVAISTAQDALDLMVDARHQGANSVMIHEKNFIKDFFDLKTGLAGEIMQKFVNYDMKLTIVGDFNKYGSESLQAFIIECNRGNHFSFVDSKMST